MLTFINNLLLHTYVTNCIGVGLMSHRCVLCIPIHTNNNNVLMISKDDKIYILFIYNGYI